MARILLGWEFGGGRGHSVRLKTLASLLAARGHEPVLAVQNVALFADAAIPVWQAPLSPRLLVNTARAAGSPPSGMGDILARLGCDDAQLVSGMIVAWRQLLAATRPDAVIGDFAPFLLIAARGSCPTARIGAGFATPPTHLASFPSLTGAPAATDEQEVLAATNCGLERAGVEPLSSLPTIFEASTDLVMTIAELDPYGAQRTEPLLPPMLSAPWQATELSGDEAFVYLPEHVPPQAAIWKGLQKSGLTIRIHLPHATANHLALFAESGFAFEPDPLSFRTIAERSRILLSHGGHGFLCSGLLAGLPQVVCHYDLEKRIYANAIAVMGLGGHVPLNGIEPDEFAASLLRLHGDSALSERARAAAPSFRSRVARPAAEIAADEVERLLG